MNALIVLAGAAAAIRTAISMDRWFARVQHDRTVDDVIATRYQQDRTSGRSW